MNRRLGIFIFHNDLRLRDNTGLIQLLENCDVVMPVFIFTPDQLGNTNKYKSINSIQFMLAALNELDAELKTKGSRLYMFFGETSSVINKLIKATDACMVSSNANYTPYALERDRKVENIVSKSQCEFILTEDYGIYPIGKFVNSGGKPYKKFTPFFNLASRTKPELPKPNKHNNYYNGHSTGVVNTSAIRKKFCGNVKPITIRSANEVLRSVSHFKKYNHDRNFLAIPTTHMSAYIKFGVISPREVYWEMHDSLGKSSSDLIKQLYWREFYMNIVWAFPYVLDGRNFNLNFRANWKTSTANQADAAQLKAWCLGQTGFPIIDACMRELNNYGYMHNRGRLITAGFLTKLLGWHWKFGERYFATKLIDYDPAQNNGNWQFVAGSGVDQQPYFRMFNPWIQSGKCDPDGEYIKKWCPEYEGFPAKVLHDQKKLTDFITSNGIKNVRLPIVDYVKSRDKTRKRYK
jgi:deoxyribodipyrimidine photo-lyase